jgi:hypothetical protein
MKLLISLSIVLLSFYLPAIPPALSLTRSESGLWIAADTLPICLDASLVNELYVRIASYTQDCGDVRHLPVVIHVAQDPLLSFPYGTEGFAGLIGSAWDHCMPSLIDPNVLICQLSEQGIERYTPVEVIAVYEQDDAHLTAGFLAHEITHACGTIDGIRCPVHPDYQVIAQSETDFCDAYWWFGVSGVFTMTPSGLLWNAMQKNCEVTSEPAICHEFEAFFEQIDWAACDAQ